MALTCGVEFRGKAHRMSLNRMVSISWKSQELSHHV